MREYTLYFIQTDINGNFIAGHQAIPTEVINKLSWAISSNPELIGIIFHDRKSGNFYKAVYSI